MTMKVNKGIIIQPQDQLSIVVTSRDPKMAVPFNLSVASFYAGTEWKTPADGQRITGYVVDNDGNIISPSLGLLHVAGLNRWELQELITEKVTDGGCSRMPS